MKILFIGASWKGSSARSLLEGLESIPETFIDEVNEDHYKPLYKSLVLRLINRLANFFQIKEFENDILLKINELRPNVIIIYKGNCIRSIFLQKIKSLGFFTVNIFPDQSPHIHGKNLKKTMGLYDLVITTKPFHPAGWKSIYGYSNVCICVPHGYDPAVHYWPYAPDIQDLDVVLAASWRPEYHSLMLQFAEVIDDPSIKISLSGPGWREHQKDFPAEWKFS